MPSIKLRVLIVEDEQLTASLLADVLRRGGFEVRVAHNAAEALEQSSDFDPDGVLIDVHLGSGPNGVILSHRLLASHPALRIVFLSRFGIGGGLGPKEEVPPKSSFISKSTISDPDLVIAAMKQAIANSEFHTVINHIIDHPLTSLTPVQLATLRLAAVGLTNQAIAELQGTVVRNIEQILMRTYAALGIEVNGVKNPRVEATRRYITTFGLPSHQSETSHDE